MHKSSIKKYAVWARNALIEEVGNRAYAYGIKENEIIEPFEMINGKPLMPCEMAQRHTLVTEIRHKGYA